MLPHKLMACLNLESWTIWSFCFKKNKVELKKKIQRKAAKVIKGMKQLPNEEQLNRLGPPRRGCSNQN